MFDMPEILIIDVAQFAALVIAFLIRGYFKWRADRTMKAAVENIETTVTKVDQRANSREQLHLQFVVDLLEELLATNPESETAQAKLAAARRRLADHIAEEAILATTVSRQGH